MAVLVLMVFIGVVTADFGGVLITSETPTITTETPITQVAPAHSPNTVHEVAWSILPADVSAASITILEGGEVHWTFQGKFLNIVSGTVHAPDGLFTSGPANQATSATEFSYIFTTAGTYPYHTAHLGSTVFATITVVPSTTHSPMTTDFPTPPPQVYELKWSLNPDDIERASITLHPGDTVRWIFSGSMFNVVSGSNFGPNATLHPSTFLPVGDGLFSSGPPGSALDFNYTFMVVGTFPYFSQYTHLAGMHAVITVVEHTPLPLHGPHSTATPTIPTEEGTCPLTCLCSPTALDCSAAQNIPSHSGMDVHHFLMDGHHFLIIANSKEGAYLRQIHSKIYIFGDDGVFYVYQDILTRGARGWEHFFVDNSHYLVVANYRDPRHDIYSSVYKREPDGFFHEWQNILTHGATDWEFFEMDNSHFLAVSNYGTETPWTRNVNSTVYRRTNDGYFEEWQSFLTHGGRKFEHFVVNNEHYLAVANGYNESAPYSERTNLNSVVHKRGADGYFEEFQTLLTYSASDIEHFVIKSKTNISTHYLAVANCKKNNWNRNIDSVIYVLGEDGIFTHHQSIPTHCAQDWQYFMVNGSHFLAVANYHNSEYTRYDTYNLQSVVYRATEDGIFREFLSIGTSAARDFEFFAAGTSHYLVVANQFSQPGSTNTNTRVYQWEKLVTKIPEDINAWNPGHTTTVNLSYKSIPVLEAGLFENMSSVRTLDLQRSSIIRIHASAFRGLTNLIYLYLQRNVITSLETGAFDGCSVSQYLDLRYNSITAVSSGAFDGLTRLRHLKLGGNRIRVIVTGTFQGLTGLTWLDLYDNKITTIEVGAFPPHLPSLSLSGNGITCSTLKSWVDSGTFRDSTTLKILWLNKNSITTVESGIFEDLRNLTTLGLSRNPIMHIESGAFDGLRRLKALELWECSITTITPGVFDGLQSLEFLYLKGNPMSCCDLDWFTPHVMEVMNNTAHVVNGGFPSCAYPASLAGESVGDVIVTEGGQKLLNGIDLTAESCGCPASCSCFGDTIDCSSRGLTVLPLEINTWNPDMIRNLTLDGNMITSLDAEALTGLVNLERLSLNGNLLTEIEFGAGLTSLTHLLLQRNAIRELNAEIFTDLTNLRVIDLSFNRLTTIRAGVFTNLSNLEELLLYHNAIHAIQPGAFEGLLTMTALNLYHNNIEDIEADMFLGVSSALKELDLGYNNISVIGPDVFRNVRYIERLYLAWNPINCCFLRWMTPSVVIMLRNGEGNHPGIAFPSCLLPPDVRGVTLVNLHPGHVTGCVTTTTSAPDVTTAAADPISTSSSTSDAVTTGTVVGLVLVAAAVFFLLQKRRRGADYGLEMTSIPSDFERRLESMKQEGLIRGDVGNGVPREIPRHCIKTLNMLGEGAFGSVQKALFDDRVHSGSPPYLVAVKTLKGNASNENKEALLNEAVLMAQVSHEHLVCLVGVVTVDDPKLIIEQYCEHGSLDKYLQEHRGSITHHDRITMVVHITSGMAYLEGKHLLHRDLAARNVLIDSALTYKVADFGLARVMEDKDYYRMSGGNIPVRWTALEVILYKRCTSKSDVWSFGVLLYEIWTHGMKPYGDWNNATVVDELERGFRLAIPLGCPETVYTVMKKCWDVEPLNRPTFASLKSYFDIMADRNADSDSGSLAVQTHDTQLGHGYEYDHTEREVRPLGSAIPLHAPPRRQSVSTQHLRSVPSPTLPQPRHVYDFVPEEIAARVGYSNLVIDVEL